LLQRVSGLRLLPQVNPADRRPDDRPERDPSCALLGPEAAG